MGATSQGNVETTKTYERIESGVYPARAIQVIELGTQEVEFKGEKKERKEIQITWEIASELMQDGRPFVVSWSGTNSLNEKAGLYKMLISWRGKPFTPVELARFEMKNILDKCCMINVTKEISKSGKEFNKVVSVMPLPKGMTCPDRVNDLIDFGICDLGTPEFDKIKGYTKTKICESREYKNYDVKNDNYTQPPFEEEPEEAF